MLGTWYWWWYEALFGDAQPQQLSMAIILRPPGPYPVVEKTADWDKI